MISIAGVGPTRAVVGATHPPSRAALRRGLAVALAEADASPLQQSRVEGQRQQILELVTAGFALEIRENYFEIAAELPQDLTARAAGWRRGFGVGDHGDAAEFAMAF